MKWLNGLLIFVPISALLANFGPHTPTVQVMVFISACLAVIPLAGIMGHATEELAKHLGPNAGGLLNATFGNAAELIIALFALRAGLLDVVQASITGSILGNLLLVLGLALLLGGRNRRFQSFNRTLAGMHSSMLVLAVAGLMVPAVFVHSLPGLAEAHGAATDSDVWYLSLSVSGVLMVTYLLGLFFSLKTHRAVFEGSDETEPAHWSRGKALTVLTAATAFVAWMSEMLVHSLEPMTQALNLSPVFVGVIVIPIIGNAAEHATAVTTAMKDKMDISLGIAIGSSTQIALFVAPFLVFASMLFGYKLSLIFTTVELVSVAFGVAIVAWIAHDGETHWYEGVLLLAVYAVISLAFFMVPPAVESSPAPAGAH